MIPGTAWALRSVLGATIETIFVVLSCQLFSLVSWDSVESQVTYLGCFSWICFRSTKP